MFTYKAADGKTTLHGMHSVPVDLRPVAEVSGARQRLWRAGIGEQHRARDVHHAESARPSMDSCVVNLDSRAAPGQGKRDARRDLPETRTGRRSTTWRKGSRRSWNRPYFDKTRVGIYGTSYGGYASVMSLLRHPGRVRRRVRLLAGDRVVSLRHGLHRALHVAAGREQGRVRSWQRHDLCEESEGPADAVLRHGRQQRAPVEYDAAHQRAAAGGKSFDLQVGPDRGPQRPQRRPHDGVLHRESDAKQPQTVSSY